MRTVLFVSKYHLDPRFPVSTCWFFFIGTCSLCLMLEKMLWFQESSMSFLTTLSSVRVFFATAVVVFPCKNYRFIIIRRKVPYFLRRNRKESKINVLQQFCGSELLISYPDPDPTFQVITDPDSTCPVITDPDPTCQVFSDPDPFHLHFGIFCQIFRSLKRTKTSTLLVKFELIKSKMMSFSKHF